MAIVELLKPTDMSRLPDFGPGDYVASASETDYNVLADGSVANAYASVWGLAFDVDAGGELDDGTILGAAIDGEDSDLIPDLIIKDLVFDGPGSSVDDAFLAGDFLQLALLLMSGDDQVFGTSGGDTLLGFAGNDLLQGGGGGDTLDGNQGRDTLLGGLGTDALGGSAGGDILIGGPGVDQLFPFVYTGLGNDNARDIIRFLALTDSGPTPTTRDAITGFIKGPGATADRIDLSPIDANPSVAGNQAFHLVAAFTAAKGEVRLLNAGGNTIVQVDGDNDLAIDMTIRVDGVVGMHGYDLIM